MFELHKLYAGWGKTVVIEDLSFAVKQGQCLSIIGRNGVGKTTLFEAITGRATTHSGRVILGERDLTPATTFEKARAGLGYVPQNREVFKSLTVAEHLQIGRRPGFWDAAAVYQLFPGLAARKQSLGAVLSGGEQQMLAIGRAYMAQPKLLMLDEPSLGLSPLLTKEIFNIISRIRQETGTAVLVVEQNAAIALAHADYGYIMELGRIVAADSCAVLSQKADVREAYLGGHSTQGISGTSQRWKRRKTWR